MLPAFYVTYHNHFDLIWRRGWQRRYSFQGLTYCSYADIEETIIDGYLRAAEKGASFQVEQALSLREYLRRKPTTLSTFQKLSKEGRFKLLGAGETIIDINLCDGETMVRNLASGIWYTRELLGYTPRIACHTDGFGSSAQFPQVVRLCEMKGINGLSYSSPDRPYWRGLDGSVVFTDFKVKSQAFTNWPCYDPCLTCRGEGTVGGKICSKCDGTRIRRFQSVPPRPDFQQKASEVSRLSFGGEESLPDEELPDLVTQANAQGYGPYVWATEDTFLPVWEPLMARVDQPGLEYASSMENNPVQTGTLVSRIRLKQLAHLVEADFYRAEKMVCLMASCAPRLKAIMDEVWMSLPLIFFHDAITGTHQDEAYYELMEMAQSAITKTRSVSAEALQNVIPGAEQIEAWAGEGVVAVFNPLSVTASFPLEIHASDDAYAVADAANHPCPIYGQPVDTEPEGLYGPVGPAYWRNREEPAPKRFRFLATDIPPLGTKRFFIRPVKRGAVETLRDSAECGNYRMGWDENGVRSIVDLTLGQELLPSGCDPAGFMILETDIGDPWGTRFFDRPRRNLAKMAHLQAARRREGCVELIYTGHFENGDGHGNDKDPSVYAFTWYQRIRLLEGLPWVEYDIDFFWYTSNRRVRLAFPSRAKIDRGIYKIPYGVLHRDRYEMADTKLYSPNGDWPATTFAATLPNGDTPGIAVLNTGTPSVRIEDGTLLYTLLRSPAFGYCLHDGANDHPVPLTLMNDMGLHHFTFGLMPYTGHNLPQVIEAGYAINQKALAYHVPKESVDFRSGLSVDAPGVYITAVKPAYSGDGITVRLVEQLGQNQIVTMNLPGGCTQVSLANALEDPQSRLSVVDGKVKIDIRAYAIVTVVLRLN